MAKKEVACFWRALWNPSLLKDSCKHPWAPAGVGMRCGYMGREDECPTKGLGLRKEEEEDEEGKRHHRPE